MYTGKQKEDRITSFLARVKQVPSGCWEWQGHCFKQGYGETSLHDHPITTHRMSWLLFKGDIVNGLRKCVNPDHLFLGTVNDNSDDMLAKGRSTRGVKQHQAKLTDDLVRALRREYHSLPNKFGFIATKSRELGVHYNTIKDVVHNKKWRHVAA